MREICMSRSKRDRYSEMPIYTTYAYIKMIIMFLILAPFLSKTLFTVQFCYYGIV